MIDGVTLTPIVFLMTTSLILLAYVLISGRRTRLTARLEDLTGEGGSPDDSNTVAHLARTALPRMGTPLLPQDDAARTLLQRRLLHAGLYGRQAMLLYLGVKMLLVVAPSLLGFLAGLGGLVPMRGGLITGACCGVAGLIGPSFWLDRKKALRQLSFRRALPDALDVLVICLEGGLSLPGAFRRVAGELRTAHPALAAEIDILLREIQLGRTTGEALRQFADRSDLEEISGLAAVITQAERYGASLVKALRVHADILREKRIQHAEEKAQKAAIKIIFPTLLCIFPGIFIVVLGPAAIQIMELFARIQQ